jgi:hypothetical protein
MNEVFHFDASFTPLLVHYNQWEIIPANIEKLIQKRDADI